MAVLKDHYYKLGSEIPQERIEAATALVKDLIAENEVSDWDYALNRLVKGLSTTRQSARFGFSMALTEVVRELVIKPDYDLTIASFISKISLIINLKSSMKGKDERSALFGMLFGLQTLMNSGLLFDSNVSTVEDTKLFIDEILNLSVLKSWLRETAIFTGCQYLNQLDLNYDISLYVLQKVNDLGLNFTTEGVAIYLTIPQTLRLKVVNDLNHVKSTWKHGDPLSRGNLPTLAAALKDVEVVEAKKDAKNDANVKQKGSWSPRVHFVWDLILDQLLSMPSDKQSSTPSKKRKLDKSKHKDVNSFITLKEFWKVVVDETLFSEKSSHERKYWGFEIFEKALSKVEPGSIPDIITPNLLRCLVNQSSQPKRMLNKISNKVLSFIKSEATKNPIKAPIILSSLIDPRCGGSWNFDLITKSKTTESLVTILSQRDDLSTSERFDVLQSLQKVLINQFNEALINDNTDTVDNETNDKDSITKKSNDSIEKWCLNMLLLLVRGNKKHIINNSTSFEWLENILGFIIKHSFFKSSEGQPTVSINVRNLCRDRLNSILGDIINTKKGDSSWSLYCVETIHKLEKSGESLVEVLDEELSAVKDECASLLQTVETLKAKSNSDKVYCFELLFSMVLLQIYIGDQDSFTVVDELKACFESTFTEDKSDEESDTSVVLTEIILSFISKKSALLRKFSYIIWESLICQNSDDDNMRVNENSLQLLFDILETKENVEGQQNLFSVDGEMEVDDGGEEGGENEGEREENEGENEENEENEDGSDSDSESDSDSDSDSESDNKELTEKVESETNEKLANALGINSVEDQDNQNNHHDGFVNFDNDDDDDEDDSYESESMDDEQMMAMDDQLSKIFKERRNMLSQIDTGNKRKSEVANAKEQMIFFKHRVLDLLEIFVKVQQNSPLVLLLIKPIISTINLTLDKNVGNKAHKLLKTKMSKCRVKSKEDDKIDKEFEKTLEQLLQWTHHQLTNGKSSNQAHLLACNQASILIAKNLVNIDNQYLDEIIDIYTESLKNWAHLNKSKTPPSLFFDFINWLNSRTN